MEYIIDRIIAIFSPMMRETLELQKLNRMMEDSLCGEEPHKTIERLEKTKWQYIQHRVDNVLQMVRFKEQNQEYYAKNRNNSKNSKS